MNLFWKIALGVMLAAIVSINVLRFCWLDKAPVGFHVDEIASAVTIECLATEGVDTFGRPYPLFSDTNFGTPKPPTQIYPGILWTKVFGFSPASFRALTGAFLVLSLVGLFFLCQQILGFRYAIVTVFLAGISPWVWILSREGWESLTCVAFLAWGMYFFLRGRSWWNALAAGMVLSLAMYAYPPMRFHVPFLILALFGLERIRSGWSWRWSAVFAGAFVVTTLPLAFAILWGSLQGRFNEISIFAPDYLASIGKTGSFADLAGLFLKNYLCHFGFKYLFLTGDTHLIHSTQHFGVLSWLDMAGLLGIVALLFGPRLHKDVPLLSREHRALLIFLAFNILVGLVPDSLTQIEAPNYMRAVGAWLFVEMLLGYALWTFSERWQGLWVGVAALGVVFLIVFMTVFFEKYGKESAGFFSPWSQEMAAQARTDADWIKFLYAERAEDYHTIYYLMNYKHVGCTKSRAIWKNAAAFFAAHGK